MARQPQSQEQAASAIDSIASRAMGIEPQAPQQQAQTAPQPQAQAAPTEQDAQPKDEGKDTSQEQAAEQGSPETEGDKMAADAVIYEVEFGDGKTRQLTPAQIKSTFERYSALNYKNAQYKPVMDLVEQIMRENPGMDSKKLAEEMQNIYKAQSANPTMGNTEGEKSGDYAKEAADQSGDLEAQLKKWEEENAASLPPGYKEMMQGQGQTVAQMQQQMAQMQQMLQAVLAQSQGVADAAKQGAQDTQQQQIQTVQQQIANNIDRVQQALQLPDDKAQDFMVFAAERGFTLEDFVDPQLTIKVMQDFKNSMDSPEMERMREIAKRRQAYTGSLGSSPSSTPAPAAAQQGQNEGTTLDRMTANIMAQRGMG
jgi:hypothetical protein